VAPSGEQFGVALEGLEEEVHLLDVAAKMKSREP
jgi:hypothetical protein